MISEDIVLTHLDHDVPNVVRCPAPQFLRPLIVQLNLRERVTQLDPHPPPTGNAMSLSPFTFMQRRLSRLLRTATVSWCSGRNQLHRTVGLQLGCSTVTPISPSHAPRLSIEGGWHVQPTGM